MPISFLLVNISYQILGFCLKIIIFNFDAWNNVLLFLIQGLLYLLQISLYVACLAFKLFNNTKCIVP